MDSCSIAPELPPSFDSVVPELICFDLDGTLVDTFRDIHACINRLLASCNLASLDEEAVRQCIGRGVGRLISGALAKAGGGNVDVDEARRSYALLYEKHCLDHSRPYPGVIETLSTVTDQRLAVLSNKPEAACRNILDGLGMSRFFSFVAGGDTFAVMKPAPDGLHALAGMCGVGIRDVLMVGDSVYDIEAAHAAGARSCAVTWGFQPAKKLKALDPDFTVNAFSELLPFLRTIKSGTINQTDN